MVHAKISRKGKNARSIMNISYFSNNELMSQKAAGIVLDEVKRKPELLLCTATGSSPTLLYQLLAEENQKQEELFKSTRVIPLDEWIGLPTSEGSCHTYIEEHIIKPLQISEDRYFGFSRDAQDFENECERIQELLILKGPIDVCILGLGKNGHLGFNEPANTLQLHCHVASLAPQSQEHSMIETSSSKPTQGLTLGMQDILASKKIILLVSGTGKDAAIKQLIAGNISNDCPATWLWKHDNVDCLILN